MFLISSVQITRILSQIIIQTHPGISDHDIVTCDLNMSPKFKRNPPEKYLAMIKLILNQYGPPSQKMLKIFWPIAQKITQWIRTGINSKTL